MDANGLARSLERFPPVLDALCRGLDPELARERPGGGWSVVEILGHIEEEERRDFRARLERTLGDPGEAWDSIDPQAWVREHDYQARDIDALLDAFAAERARSLAWLRGLVDPDWSRAHAHPALGTIRAGDLLVAWVAHDALHLRQLALRMHQGAARLGAPFEGKYAGPW